MTRPFSNDQSLNYFLDKKVRNARLALRTSPLSLEKGCLYFNHRIICAMLVGDVGIGFPIVLPAFAI